MSGFAQSFLDVDGKHDDLPGTPRDVGDPHSKHVTKARSGSMSIDVTKEDDALDAYFALDEDESGGVHVQVVSAGLGTATMESCIVNLCNTILGAGMLGLPHALGNSGWMLGMFLMLSMCWTAGFGLYLLAVCSFKAQQLAGQQEPQSFYTLAMRTIPGWGPMIVDAAVAIKCFGVGTSYFIVVGDLVPEALEGFTEHVSNPWGSRQFWILLYAFILCGPLILKKNLDALKFTSGAALGFVVFIVVVFLIFVSGAFDTCPNGYDDGHKCGTSEYSCKNDCSPTTAGPKGALDALEVFTIFIFGFTCHQNIFSVSNELERSNSERVKTVIQVSLSSCLVVYILVASCGYILYGQDVKSDVLKSFPQKNMLLILGRFAISLLVAFSYPLQIHPCRNSLRQLLFGSRGYYEGGVWVPGEGGLFPNVDRSESAQEWRFYVMTGCLFFGSLGISMMVHSLGLMLAVVGATGSTTISYILPGYFYISLFADEERGPMYYGARTMFIAGCIIIPCALGLIAGTGKGGG